MAGARGLLSALGNSRLISNTTHVSDIHKELAVVGNELRTADEGTDTKLVSERESSGSGVLELLLARGQMATSST